MQINDVWLAADGLVTGAPAAVMALMAVVAWCHREAAWRGWMFSAVLALVLAVGAWGMAWVQGALGLSHWMAVLVQLLGVIIGAFSWRYLSGEPGQRRYVVALAGVLAAVHVLLQAQHWAVLILAWALVGWLLQPLLCFYAERPFALLAAHKKRLADRLADVLLISAAALAWHTVGSGALPDLWSHLATHGASWPLQLSAVCLVLAAVLRTALLPVHGWLIQVMEAPTPVSALMHAGVVNLSGVVLIGFAPLLNAAPVAQALLVVLGLLTAGLAGLVMLTRISIKVRLAWSTVAQMGFMLMEIGLGLYTLAALHLIGHSLYKAHAFLSASGVVRHTRLQHQQGRAGVAVLSQWLAPVVAMAVIVAVGLAAGQPAWPLWWSAVLALAWAPLLWGWSWPAVCSGVALVALLAGLTTVGHALPLGLADAPLHWAGWGVVLGMAALYGCLVAVQRHSPRLERWRRWSYAGFYVDETYTRLALRWWPTGWAVPASGGAGMKEWRHE